MKRLILMRHAKSDWSTAAQTDHARPLNPRGQRSAVALGDWLRKNKYLPDEILCSDAMRTRETLIGLTLGEVPTRFTRDLYLAEPEAMAAALRHCTQDCILMVAHNPGSAMLAEMLLGQPPTHSEFATYPTCATLVADFGIHSWDKLAFHSGTPVDFIVPRDLIK
ncbi:histidine phosphatase family protein [uncultured Sulfitobacter sp.]|uniref:SixA phosphatase family protein n=1 Tax=uncultured Sulfitobacter sp. TaxID=191468 RepID=UPI0026130441|nr:histidine phosphatase family protein [uncultured Sulfitobacter sp.]